MNTRRLGAGLAGAALLIAGMTALSRVVGFGRWLVFSDSVGSTAVGNAYLTANQLPNVLFEVAAGGALAGAVVPLLAGPLARRSHREVDRIASALLTWTVVVLLPVSVLLAVAAGSLVPLLSPPGAAAAQLELGVRLLLVFSPQVVLYGVGVVLSGVLQAHRRFLWPALVPLLSSIVVIVAYRAFAATAQGAQERPAVLPGSAEAWLGWGTTAGVAAMSLPLLLPTLRTGVRLRPAFAFPPGVAARARRLAAAGIGALLAQQAAVLTTVVLANWRGGNQAFPVFLYAQAVYLLPYAVLAVPLATSAFPRLAELAAEGERDGFARTTALSTRAVVAVAAAGAVALVAAAPAVAGLFGLLDVGEVPGLGEGLSAMAAGLVGFALVAHLSRVLYAVERGRAAAVATAAGWAGVVVASVVAVVALTRSGVDVADTVLGLGVGSSVGMGIAGLSLLAAVRRAAGSTALAGLGRTAIAVGIGALAGAPVGRVVTDALLGSWGVSVVSVVPAAVLGAVVGMTLVATAVAVGDRSSVAAMLARGGHGGVRRGSDG